MCIRDRVPCITVGSSVLPVLSGIGLLQSNLQTPAFWVASAPVPWAGATRLTVAFSVANPRGPALFGWFLLRRHVFRPCQCTVDPPGAPNHEDIHTPFVGGLGQGLRRYRASNEQRGSCFACHPPSKRVLFSVLFCSCPLFSFLFVFFLVLSIPFLSFPFLSSFGFSARDSKLLQSTQPTIYQSEVVLCVLMVEVEPGWPSVSWVDRPSLDTEVGSNQSQVENQTRRSSAWRVAHHVLSHARRSLEKTSAYYGLPCFGRENFQLGG